MVSLDKAAVCSLVDGLGDALGRDGQPFLDQLLAGTTITMMMVVMMTVVSERKK